MKGPIEMVTPSGGRQCDWQSRSVDAQAGLAVLGLRQNGGEPRRRVD